MEVLCTRKHCLSYRFPTEIFGEIDITTIRWETEPIVVDKTLEERGIETAGNGVWSLIRSSDK